MYQRVLDGVFDGVSESVRESGSECVLQECAIEPSIQFYFVNLVCQICQKEEGVVNGSTRVCIRKCIRK